MSGPFYNPSVPYSGSIPGGFLPGRMVRVQGRVNTHAQRLTINLQTGPNPYDDVALHFNPRFDENVIVRNALISSAWGPEERHGPPLPILRDQNFEVLILCEASFFKIAVNGQHFAEFNHRLQPLDRINYLSIEGDLTISLIQFDGTSQSGTAYGASAPPGGYAPSGTPYPPASSLPTPGFSIPPQGMAPPPGGSPYPAAGASPYPSQQQPYGGYPPPGGAPPYYPPQQPGYPGQHGYPPPGVPGGYPGQQGYPPPGQQGYAPPGQPGYYQPQGGSGHGGGGGGLLGDAGKLLAGGLAGVGLGKVASKIPGLGGGGHGHGHGQYGHSGGHGHGGGGMGGILPGGVLGGAAALAGGALAHKGMKKHKKKGNLMKYGLPVGGAVLGGYALKKGMKGFHGGSSSSSSSSSEEE